MTKEVEKYIPLSSVATVVTEEGKADLRATVGSMVEIFIASHPETYVEDSDQAMLDIITHILDAPSVEDIMSPQNAEGVRDTLDRPFQVDRFSFGESEFNEGAPWFMIIHGRMKDNNEEIVMTTGAIRIMAQLMRCQEIGALPVTVVARKAKRATRKGFFPLRLELA